MRFGQEHDDGIWFARGNVPRGVGIETRVGKKRVAGRRGKVKILI